MDSQRQHQEPCISNDSKATSSPAKAYQPAAIEGNIASRVKTKYKTRGSGPKHDFVPIFLNAAEGIKSLINTHTQEYGQAVCPDLMLILKIFNNRLALV